MRGVTSSVDASEIAFSFQLTRLMRGVTRSNSYQQTNMDISTHTPHARRDDLLYLLFCNSCIFQLTRLMRGVTGRKEEVKANEKFQLTRLMRGVTLYLV